MEKKNFFPFLVPVFSIVAVLLSLLAVVLSVSAIGSAKGASLACLSQADSSTEPDVSGKIDPSADFSKSQQITSPEDQAPATEEVKETTFYTLRLITSQDSKAPPCIGIYDAHEDLLQSIRFPAYATLDKKDLALLHDGIRADNWASLAQLLCDYTE